MQFTLNVKLMSSKTKRLVKTLPLMVIYSIKQRTVIKAPLAEIFILSGKRQISTTVSEIIWAFRFIIEIEFIP